jgi:hypothetical protein
MAELFRGRRVSCILRLSVIAASAACGCGHGATGVAAEGTAGAKLDKPLAMSVNSGACESDGQGTIGATFGSALAFNIGPQTGAGAFLKMNLAPYKGPRNLHQGAH